MFTDLPKKQPERPTIKKLSGSEAVRVYTADGLPPLPPDEDEMFGVFSRHAGIPGHRQERLAAADIVDVGAGGLGSWNALGLLRSGSGKTLTIIDPDRVERGNLNRQLFTASDIGKWKAFALAENLLPHALLPTRIVAIALPFEEVIAQQIPLSASLISVGVDNNYCRLACARWARARRIPAVFTMLSLDGMRLHCFLQGAKPTDACLRCALPNLDPEKRMPCAHAIITSCLLAAAFTTFFCHRALIGEWPAECAPFNWREADVLELDGAVERTGMIVQRSDCPTCRSFRS